MIDFSPAACRDLEAQVEKAAAILGGDGPGLHQAVGLAGDVAGDLLRDELRGANPRKLEARAVEVFTSPGAQVLAQAITVLTLGQLEPWQWLLASAAFGSAALLTDAERRALAQHVPGIVRLDSADVQTLRAVVAAGSTNVAGAGVGPDRDLRRRLEDLRDVGLVDGDRPTRTGAAFARSIERVLERAFGK